MKKFLILTLSLLVLTACKPSETAAPATPKDIPPAQAQAVSPQQGFDNMTEDEQQAYMIKLIEQKEAQMKASGEL
jgi:hypothetical protein